jgi:hypothetical protein
VALLKNLLRAFDLEARSFLVFGDGILRLLEGRMVGGEASPRSPSPPVLFVVGVASLLRYFASLLPLFVSRQNNIKDKLVRVARKRTSHYMKAGNRH